jgi:hypothetical protein
LSKASAQARITSSRRLKSNACAITASDFDEGLGRSTPLLELQRRKDQEVLGTAGQAA